MKIKLLHLVVSLSLALMLGTVLGVLIQRNYGLGNILRSVGIPYPTRTFPAPPTPLPIDEIPPAYQGRLSLFILAGQSNMVGLTPLPDSQARDPQIFVFGNDYHWRIAREPVDNPNNQVDKVSEDRAASFSPSLAFATTMRSHRPGLTIGLIPCAKSSTAIIDWQRNLSEQSLYGSCLKRAQAASTMGHIAGILFFQGETDTIEANEYPQYKPSPEKWSALFTAFVTNMRTDLGQGNVPVVFAQIGANINPTGAPYWDLVKEQQRTTQLVNSAMITTDDLASIDGLHFTTDSIRVIGERFAEAYLALLERNGQ